MMEYRRLGNTGLEVGTVGVGCMTFGWRAHAAEADQIVAAALDIGINLFDTAVSYGRGVSETMLGQALKRSGRRNDALIATKFGGAATVDAKPGETGNSRLVLRRQCELSLGRLETDWIDILQVHHFSADVPIGETLEGLDQLVREGKVRHVGCSNFTGEQLSEAIECADREGFQSIASHQARLNLLDRRAETDVLPRAHRHGVANLAYSPLAEGLLTGKYAPDGVFPAGSRFAAASPANGYRSRLTAEVTRAINSFAAAAAAYSMPPWQFALSWVLSNPTVCCAVLGPSDRNQVEALARLRALPVNREIERLIDSINPAGSAL